MSKELAIFLLFSSVRTDFTSYHLHHFLDHSASPCDDFYRHVCPRGLNETVRDKTERFYKRLAEQADSRNRNNPVMNDIYESQESESFLRPNSYKVSLWKRCAWQTRCYKDEFFHFFNILKEHTDEYHDLPSRYATKVETKTDVIKLVDITAEIVVWLFNRMHHNFRNVIRPYMNLRDRLSIISALPSHDANEMQIIREKVRRIENLVKEAIAMRFNKTDWLITAKFRFSPDRLEYFLSTLDKMKVILDLDELDNLRVWRNYDRMITAKYFIYSERSSGSLGFDVYHSFFTLIHEIRNKPGIPFWDYIMISRISHGFEYNAYHNTHFNSVRINAPLLFPLLRENSTDTTMFGFAALLAHEIFHKFITDHISEINDGFRRETDCISDHFKKSCDIWAEGLCHSGSKTVYEDAPDVEGIRVAYDLLKERYTNEQLKELEYEDLGITREQSFFYAIGARLCKKDLMDVDESDAHSVENVRLNGALSLIPEFSSAFGCKKGDREYSTEASSCFLFGPLSGADKQKTIQELEKSKDDIDDSSELEGSGSGEEPKESRPIEELLS